MRSNIGKIDKMLRVTFAVVVAFLYFTGVIDGVVAAILGVVAIVFVATVLLGTCPIYLILKLSTNK